MDTNGSEQLSLTRLIEVTVDDFDNSLKGWKLYLLAVHSRVKPVDLAKTLAKERGLTLFDERRRLTLSEAKKRDYLDELIGDAEEYSAWVYGREFQPLLRDLLVGQCVGFENFLKTLGVASFLSNSPESLEKLIFVPSEVFRKTHQQANVNWENFNKSSGVIGRFIEERFIKNSVFMAEFSGLKTLDIERWSKVWIEISRLRNAIVHSRARPTEQIELGEEIFSPFDEAQITERTLRSVDKAFQVVISAFRLSLSDV